MSDNDILKKIFKKLEPQYEAMNLIFAITLIPLSISFFFREGFFFMAVLDSIFSIISFLMHFFRKKLTLQFRLTITLLAFLIYSIISLYRGGFTGNGLLGLTFVIVIAVSFLGKKRAFIIVSTACFVLVTMTFAIFAGYIDLHKVYAEHYFDKAAWIYQSFILILFAVILFLTVYAMKSMLMNYISKLVDSEEQLRGIAYKDNITGLPNRAFFSNEMFKTVENHKGEPFVMAILDIVNFRLINTFFGMEEGDRVLKDVGAILERSTSQDVTVARIGSNEFLMLAFKWDENRLNEFVDELTQEISVSIEFLRGLPKLRFIVAFVEKNLCQDEFDMIQSDLSIALKYGKEKGLSGVFAYETYMREKYEQESRLLSRIETALTSNQFDVFFQGIWDASKDCFISYEALARWNDDGAHVSPDLFIPLITKSPYFIPFSQYIFIKSLENFSMLSKVLDQKSQETVENEMQTQGKKAVSLSINISPAFFCSENFTDFILGKVDESGIDPSRIILEITEDTFISNYNKVNDVISCLRKKGIRISLDDFGSGYSSLSHLNQIRIDVLKIDKSLIRNIQDNEKSQVLLSGIMTIAGKMGYEVVAEGVETEAELDIVREMGCHVIQGYYYSKPQEVKHWIFSAE